jgi:uncharacterized membrane protein (DUF2068 family)
VGSSGHAVRSGVRTVAAFEAAKGVVVLLAGFGLLGLIHRDVQTAAEHFVERLHLNPARHYPHIFIDAASQATDARLWMLAWLAFCYATLRLVEAYGLSRERRWAQWFALISGGVYLPLEVVELALGVTVFKALALVVNAGIVGYMAYVLRRPQPAP